MSRKFLILILQLIASIGLMEARDLEPIGYGPFQDPQTRKNNEALSKVFRLDDDVPGFGFVAVHQREDGSAFSLTLSQSGNADWKFDVAQADSALKRIVGRDAKPVSKDVAERTLNLVTEALLRTEYHVERAKDVGPFVTGGGETFIAARPSRTFVAGRTWNPAEGSVAWFVEKLVLEFDGMKDREKSEVHEILDKLEEALSSE